MELWRQNFFNFYFKNLIDFKISVCYQTWDQIKRICVRSLDFIVHLVPTFKTFNRRFKVDSWGFESVNQHLNRWYFFLHIFLLPHHPPLNIYIHQTPNKRAWLKQPLVSSQELLFICCNLFLYGMPLVRFSFPQHEFPVSVEYL